jgi:PIN domain nuclease of toxin-antitoxin system
VRLLLDTHVLLWWLADDPTLSSSARSAITDGQNLIAVSAVTAWEISIKQALGTLVAPNDLEQQVEASGFSPLPITLSDGVLAGNLPHYHSDPFDRMLVAQARRGGFTVVTRDHRLHRYGVEVLPA